jgi:hypothetical protein
LIEETFFPQLVSTSPIMAGIQEIPQLNGYVGTSEKDAAQVILSSNKGDPILAAWQYGLGRSVAFTSDATGRWAKEWISWDNFPSFWNQVVSYIIAQQNPSQLEIGIKQNGEQAQITVDARQMTILGESITQGSFMNGYTMQANIVSPDRTTLTISLRQTAPGHYIGEFLPDQQGVYLVHIVGTLSQLDDSGTAQEPLTDTTGWVLSYSPEYRSLESDPDELYRIVVSTGGRIASQNPANTFAHTLSSPPTTIPIWSALLLTALLLLPLDIAARRLVFTRADLHSILVRLQPKHILAGQNTSAPSSSTQIENLFYIKEQATRRRKVEKAPAIPASVQPKDSSEQEESSASKEINFQNQSGSTSDTTINLDSAGDIQTTASRLLAHKQTRRVSEKQKKNDKK